MEKSTLLEVLLFLDGLERKIPAIRHPISKILSYSPLPNDPVICRACDIHPFVASVYPHTCNQNGSAVHSGHVHGCAEKALDQLDRHVDALRDFAESLWNKLSQTEQQELFEIAKAKVGNEEPNFAGLKTLIAEINCPGSTLCTTDPLGLLKKAGF